MLHQVIRPAEAKLGRVPSHVNGGSFLRGEEKGAQDPSLHPGFGSILITNALLAQCNRAVNITLSSSCCNCSKNKTVICVYCVVIGGPECAQCMEAL